MNATAADLHRRLFDVHGQPCQSGTANRQWRDRAVEGQSVPSPANPVRMKPLILLLSCLIACPSFAGGPQDPSPVLRIARNE